MRDMYTQCNTVSKIQMKLTAVIHQGPFYPKNDPTSDIEFSPQDPLSPAPGDTR